MTCVIFLNYNLGILQDGKSVLSVLKELQDRVRYSDAGLFLR